jgi:hypothetical protein
MFSESGWLYERILARIALRFVWILIMDLDSRLDQITMCRSFGVEPAFVDPGDRLGVARSFDATRYPINALRHPPHGNMAGWYIWSGGEIPPDDPDFFTVTHAAHLDLRCPLIVPYLAMPSGWRVLLGEAGYVDVWHDPKLLDI